MSEAAPPTGADGTSQSVARTVTIANRRGLHARAAGKLAKTAGQFVAEITVARGGQTVSGRSILGLMMLAAAAGNTVDIAARGPDAESALAAVCALIEAKFDEE